MSVNTLRFNFLADNNFSRTANKVGDDTDSLAKKVGKFGKTAAIAFGAVAAGGVLALGKAFKDGVTAADAYQKLALKTGAVIKSTGNQAHISVGGVQALAAQLESLGTTDEELIINSQNVLATFTNIRNVGKNRIFDMATRSTLDMSVALGTDLQGASIQVGKALNDPIKGVAALTKVGVSFTQAQKDQIKALVESGRTMDAQKIILGELNKEFGGAAKAAGSGFSGAVFRAKDAIGDLERDIAAKALPALTSIADWVATKGVPKLRIFSDWMSSTGAPKLIAGFKTARAGAETVWAKLDLTNNFQTALSFVETDVIPRLKSVFKGLAAVISPIDIPVTLLGKSISDGAVEFGSQIIDGATAGIKTGDWSGLGKTIGDGLTKAMAGLNNVTQALGKLFADIDWLNVGKAIGRTAAPLALGFTLTLIDGLIEAFKKHPGEVLFAIATLIPIGKIFAVFKPLRGMLEALPFGKWIVWGLDHTAVKVFDAMWNFIKFAGRGFAKGFAEIFPVTSRWISRLTGRIGTWLRLSASGLANAARDMIEGIFIGIGRQAGKATRIVGRVIEWLTRPFRRAGGWLIDEGSRLVGGLISGISGRAGSLISSLGRMIGRITGRFAPAGQWLVLSGRRLLAGLYEGMLSKVSDAGRWAASVGGRIVRAVKSFFGIASPSKVFRSMGSNLITSLFTGMVDKNPVQSIGKIFGSMPKALGALVDKGLISIKNLPAKAMKALSGLGGKFADVLGFGGGGGSVMSGGLSAAERWIIMHESGGRTNADNPTSTAFGLGQLLLANRQHYGAILGVSAGTTDFGAQLKMFRMYVRDRYSTAENAQAFWQAHHWYGSGGVVSRPSLVGVGEKGPERVLSATQTRTFDRLIPMLSRGLPAGAGGLTVNIYATGSDIELENKLVRVITNAKRHGRLRD